MLKKPNLLTSLLLAMFVAFTTTAQQTGTTDKPEADSTTGVIRGMVVNESGQPLAGASVMVRMNKPTGSFRSATSDSDGNFQVTNLERALYSVTATAPAYAPRPRSLDEQPSFTRVGDSVRIELVRGGVITGTVTNAANEPVIAVRVVALRVRDEEGKAIKNAAFATGERNTDDRGIYRIFGLLPGTYIVMAGGSTGFGFQLNPYDMDVPTYAPSATRDTAVEVTVRSGEEITVDIRYRGEPGRVVSGRVKGEPGPAFINVTMSPADSSSGVFSSTVQPPGARGFRFNGVADGVYDLIAQQSLSTTGSEIPDIAFSEPYRITVKGADVTGIELIPKPMAMISGKVVLEASNLEACKDKRRPLLAETVVTLHRNRKNAESDAVAERRPFFPVSSPDRDGAIMFRGLAPGQYTFTTQFFARYWYVQSITLPGTAPATAKTATSKIDALKNWTTIKPGDRLTGVTITLAEGAASLRGRLDVPENTNLDANLDLYLVPAEKEKADDPLRYFVTQPLADGSFSVDNLPPGRYRLLAQRSSGTERLRTAKLQLPDAAESRLKVRRSAEAVDNTVELKPCQNVTDHRLRLNPLPR